MFVSYKLAFISLLLICLFVACAPKPFYETAKVACVPKPFYETTKYEHVSRKNNEFALELGYLWVRRDDSVKLPDDIILSDLEYAPDEYTMWYLESLFADTVCCEERADMLAYLNNSGCFYRSVTNYIDPSTNTTRHLYLKYNRLFSLLTVKIYDSELDNFIFTWYGDGGPRWWGRELEEYDKK
jgi:hypothetical protein